jgi:DUF4097 and DUF4098 domain-containing protein YvlB
MARRSTRSWGTVFWAAILVAVGGVLLARNLGYSVPIWRGLATYWPVLIIVWGVVKAAEAIRMRSSSDARGSVFSAGEVVLVVFVLIAGAMFTTAVNLTGDLRIADIVGEVDIFDLLGENFEFRSEMVHEIEAVEAVEAVEAGRVIEIRNGAGSVVVEAGEDGVIVLGLRKRVRASSEERAAEIEPQLDFTLEDRGGRYVIESNYESLSEDLQQRLRSGLTVRVPREFSVVVANAQGPVAVSDLRGNQSVVNRYGGVTLSRIEGNIEVDNRSGSSVLIEDGTGSLTVQARYVSVDVRNHDGLVDIDTQYAPVIVTDVTGNVEVSNRYSDISIRGVGGNVAIGGGHNRVELDDVVGSADVETSYRSLELRDIGGAISAVNRHGDVDVVFSAPPSETVTVSGDYSDIRVQLPAFSEFSLEAQARSGSFESDFEGFDRESVRRDTRVSGSVGGAGPLVRLNTARGNIRVLGR